MNRAFSAVAALVLCLCAVCVCAVAPARAQHRGAVLDFSGRAAGTARQVVVGVADDFFELERQAQVTRTAGELGADLGTAQGMAQVAQALRLSVLFHGEVSGRPGRQRVTVFVYDVDGVEIGKREGVALGRGRNGRRRLEAAAQELAQEAVMELERRAEAQRQRELAADRQEIARLESDLEGEEESEPAEPSDLPLLVAMGGFGGRNRSADIDLASGNTRIYDAGFFPELSVRVTSHPLTRSGGALAGLFADLEFAFALGLSSVDEGDPANPADDVEIDTSAFRFLGALGYLASAGPLYVGGSLGFGIDSFSLAANTVMPTTSYSHLRIGLLGRVPVVEDEAYTVHAQLDAGLRLVLGTGELAPMFADSASATGFDVEGALGATLASGLAFALRFGLETYALSFEGDAMIPSDTARDGQDTAFILTANAGWTLR